MKGKHIVLGITGSIAAYKACTLIRLFIKAGAEVQVVITPAGKEFITPTTLSALTSKPVICDFFNRNSGEWHSHVDLGLWADAMIIAPATASTIGKMAHGIADNMLITTYLSMKAPVFIAPAMDLDMFAHQSTQNNIATLKRYGNHIISPAEGELASHLIGKGRMEEPEVIFTTIRDFFKAQQQTGLETSPQTDCTDEQPFQDERPFQADMDTSKRLAGKRIMITAGPTYEKIDPVRFIGNHSSGKMGIALAEACLSEGASVDLIVGPVNCTLPKENDKLHIRNVVSADDMHNAALNSFRHADAAILCAAVADYKVKDIADSKIKRKGEITLQLVPTCDIAADLGQIKQPNQRLVGFALETDNEEPNAKVKLAKKNLDFIVLNSLRDEGAGFACDTNKISIISSDEITHYPLKSKKAVAYDIINKLCDTFKP